MRLIDADALVRFLDFCVEEGLNKTCADILKPAVIEAPTIDAVLVVRCRDCKHRHEDECPMFFEEQVDIDEGDGYYDTDYIFHDYTRDDGYCSWGERRTDE